ncbi:hypothetical protein [Micromonospora halophytica]|uniref:Uncharacterized protein n=1 Tax=Micromonospora halophytica TaxID=47864 RepID=A0A1C5J8Q9_9ACTN|nr:hypothetical protein [Micromonospora halophytica]SCG66962.1 hypothetical protein GA0070560_12447 [Micromonospora halophytica]
MQPGSPFQLLETLGSCQVGKVWSAVDAQGRALTVAILDEAVATDQQWRQSFASIATALRDHDGRPSYLHADFTAPAPWVAYAAGGGAEAEQVFVVLGLDYRPTSTPAQAQPTDPGTTEPPWAQLAFTEPTQAMPIATSATSPDAGQYPAEVVQGGPAQDRPTSGPGVPVSTPPSPTSVPPASPVSVPPSAPDGSSPWVEPHPTSYPALRSTVRERPRRTGLWVGIAIAVVVALGAGAGIFVWRSAGDAPGSAGPESSAAASSSPEPVAFPTGAPRSPGVEPPKPGSWPTEPQFGDADGVKDESPAGLGFTFKVPDSWACDARQRGPGFARYLCGISRPGVPEVGGEIIVRNCPKPCGEEVQAAYRRAEEAWGLQWVQAGNTTFAESPDIDGKDRYGLVVIGWWRSSPDGVVDRQVVIRMTAPAAQVGEVRKVANGIRTTLSL